MHPPVQIVTRAGARYHVRVEPDGRVFVGDYNREAFTEREILRGRPGTAATTPWAAHRARARAR